MNNLLNRLENETDFEFGLRLIKAKCESETDLDWEDLVELLKLDCHRDSLRKACNVTDYSAYKVIKYFEDKIESMKLDGSEDNNESKALLRQLESERIKIRTQNLEKRKIERTEDRRDLYYENIGHLVEQLEVPKLNPIFSTNEESAHIMDFADVHYNSTFTAIANSYSREEAKLRFEKLLGETIEYINDNKVDTLYIINGGDSLQGMLRASDLKLNDLGVIDSLVDFQKIMARFLNELSVYCNIRYYHVNSANHTELRLLNSQAGQMAVEDMEKIIVNYLHDVLIDNERIFINTEFKESTIQFRLLDFEFICVHGHQIKNIKTSIKDLSDKYDKPFDFLIMGHYHSGVEMVVGERKGYAKEVLVCPSFVGTCPYADSLMVGGKSTVKIHKFVKGKGRKTTYNIVLN